MLAAATACLVLPLWRRRGEPGQVEALASHNRQLATLERHLKKGDIATAHYLAERQRLEQSLQAQLATGDETPRAAPARTAAVIVGVLMPVFAMGIYFAIGNWRAATGGEEAAEQGAVNEMVDSLAQRLNTTDQGDANGWIMLGRSYVVLGKYSQAVSAYTRAYGLLGDSNPDLLADYAEAIILTDPAKMTSTAAPLLDKALTAQPENSKALWYSGLIALQQHHNNLAIARWQKILAQNPAPEIRQMVEQHIQQAGGASTPPAVAVAGGPAIAVHVTLAAALAGALPDDATLFVFVRPVGSNGGPPLLVERMQVDKLPVDLSLTDANAMMPGTSLANYRQVNVTARLSRHGGAIAQPGDFEGDAVVRLAGSASHATVAIDRVVR